MTPGDDLLKRYQEANAHDTLRPAPALREKVLAQARAAASAQVAPAAGRPHAANDAAWRWRALGGLAVLGLATLVVLQFDRGPPEERGLALGDAASPPAVGMTQSERQAPPPAVVYPAAPPTPAAPRASTPPSSPPPQPRGQAVNPSPAVAADTAPAEPAAQAAASVDQGTEQRARSVAREEAPAARSLRSAAPPALAARPNDALLAAAASGDIAGARGALAQGADVNTANTLGRSALMMAARRGDEPLVRLLLGTGADPLRADRDGLRAADLAQQAGHGALLPLLDAPR